MVTDTLLFNDFQAEYQDLKNELWGACRRVLKSGCFILGAETTALEQELADQLGCHYVVTVANGTEAIAIALMISGVKPGDEVIVPALTAYPTIIGIELARAIPVVCDVDTKTGLLDPTQVASLITNKTKAIMPVHLYGQLCAMPALSDIAKTHNLVIVEDCAQAILAKHKTQLAGSWSQAAALSFYPTKNLGAYGDAGAVMTNDPELYERAKKLRQYGQSSRYNHDEFGFNSRMDELQAAILRVKLPHLAGWIKKRRQIAQYYLAHLSVGRPLAVGRDNFHTYHLFVTKMRQRNKFLSYCEDHQLPVIVHYPRTVYQQPAFTTGRFQPCPKAERLVNQVVSLPIHPHLIKPQIRKICHIVNQFSV